MNECCVAEFQRHQIEENVIKKKENRSRKCAEKCIGSLELQEKSMEEMRVAECIKQEAHKKALLNQIKVEHTWSVLKSDYSYENYFRKTLKSNKKKIVKI